MTTLESIKGQSWVINLNRRKDRRNKFSKNYRDLGPDLPLNFVTAIDGTNPKDFKIPEIQPLLNHIDDENNDYDSNPRIKATVLSHMKVWRYIAEGECDYGLIFEDDIFFREPLKEQIGNHFNTQNNTLDFNAPFKKLWPQMERKFIKSFIDGDSIIYFGVGDFLPIHTNPPTENMLKAQEKSHVTKIVNNFFGNPKYSSSYVFDWLGGFSYALSKNGAKRLLEISKEIPLKTAVDAWLKTTFGKNIYLTVPLLTYHSNYDFNIYDSDTWGVSVPIDDDNNNDNNDDNNENDAKKENIKKKSITFLIPTKKRVDTLEKVINSILANSSGYLKINFIINVDDDDQKTKDFIHLNKERFNIISQTCSTPGKRYLHNMYNMMSYIGLNSTFIAIWDDDTVITTESWDKILLKYYTISDIESKIESDLNLLSSQDTAIACFQLAGNEKSSWEFGTPILTSNFVRKIGHVSKSASVLEYIKFVAYLSHTNMFIKNIKIEKIDSNRHEYNKSQIDEAFRTDPTVKYNIDKDVKKIMESPDYKACGIWIKTPEGWNEKNLIGDMVNKLNLKR